MDQPKVSIIIPMFNVENYVETCIKSILAQTFKDFELILIDDCSTDRTYEIVKNYRDPRIRLFRNMQNAGQPGYGFNKGLELSSESKYVYFMDSDDAIAGNTIETFYNAAEESQADVVYMNSHFVALDPDFQITKQIQTVQTTSPDMSERFMSEDLAERLKHEHIDIGVAATPWIKFFRRDFLFEKQIYFPLVRGIEDFFQNFATLCFARKIKVINACCYIYRQNFAGASRQSNSKSMIQIVDSFIAAIKYMDAVLSKTELSHENQLILKTHAVEFLIQERIARYEPTIEELDEILQEVTRRASVIDPDVIRMLIHVAEHMIIWAMNTDKNSSRLALGKKLFFLK